MSKCTIKHVVQSEMHIVHNCTLKAGCRHPVLVLAVDQCNPVTCSCPAKALPCRSYVLYFCISEYREGRVQEQFFRRT